MQVADVHANWTLEAIEPRQESVPQRSRSDVLERRYYVEVHDVGRVQGYEAVKVLCLDGLGLTA